MAKISINLKGRVNNFSLPDNQTFLPLFEAVVNSFHAIEERKEKNSDFIDGKIDITLVKEDCLKDNDSELFEPVIKDILITDNGIGFDEQNFSSFLQSDSTYKQDKGGKGVGRFSWLKAFDEVKVESNFLDEVGVFFYREFDFNLDSIDINDSLKMSRNEVHSTTVSLKSFKKRYQEKADISLKGIATQILHHCLIYFINSECPRVTISNGAEKIDLNELFDNEINTEKSKKKIDVNGQIFELLHVKMEETPKKSHQLFLCANNRVVTTKNIANFIVDLEGKINDDTDFWYAGVLTGEYLDEKVDMNRLSFTNIPQKGGYTLSGYEPSMQEIYKNCKVEIEEYLANYLSQIKKVKLDRVNEYISEEAPQFRHLLSHKIDEIGNLKPHLSNDELDDELHRIKRSFDNEVKIETENIINDIKNKGIDNAEYGEKFKKLVSKVSETNRAALADYVTHRKVILNLFELGLHQDDNGTYEKESFMHNLIYPMRKTSEDIEYDNHNLWLIDERLAYHSYISSDVPFNNDNKEDRTDLLILDSPVAVIEGENTEEALNSVVLFELKKPMRKNYSDSDNPINQIYKYVKKINSGKALDKNGRSIITDGRTRFYAYILCDINDKIKDFAEQADFSPTTDGQGFYKYNKQYNVQVEIIPYRKVLNDSKKRNRIFFEKLGIK